MEKSLDSVQSRTCEGFDAFRHALETGIRLIFLIRLRKIFISLFRSR